MTCEYAAPAINSVLHEIFQLQIVLNDRHLDLSMAITKFILHVFIAIASVYFLLHRFFPLLFVVAIFAFGYGKLEITIDMQGVVERGENRANGKITFH